IADFLFKNLPWTEIRARLQLRIEAALDAKKSALIREEVESHGQWHLVGVDPAMGAVIDKADRVAGTDAAVLLLGESGTGKELVARRIHEKSRRHGSAFVAVNCGALDESLVRSELFGHVKGAFTGAVGDRAGKFELAHGGTLFLDEVGELSSANQVSLLRVLEEKTFERVGGTDTLECDVRLIAATNRDLEAMIVKGEFREDLFFRLYVFPLRIPPLRERPGDIRALAEHFARTLASQAGKRIQGISREALSRLSLYPWPGNVRQLRNAIEYALILEPGEEIQVESLPPLVGSPRPAAAPPSGFRPGVTYDQGLNAAERAMLDAALEFCKGDTTLAAQQLAVPLRTLQRRLKVLGVNPGSYRNRSSPE
ncbi:MAG: sigma-54-dependent Fis family transcriptional regulator, partial [Candidatus Riflebacteria bacterium]|nr:sigma-54-dependent Fis family transcriptional regulator [Candidatus Riflebacteria bacterium]